MVWFGRFWGTRAHCHFLLMCISSIFTLERWHCNPRRKNIQNWVRKRIWTISTWIFFFPLLIFSHSGFSSAYHLNCHPSNPCFFCLDFILLAFLTSTWCFSPNSPAMLSLVSCPHLAAHSLPWSHFVPLQIPNPLGLLTLLFVPLINNHNISGCLSSW